MIFSINYKKLNPQHYALVPVSFKGDQNGESLLLKVKQDIAMNDCQKLLLQIDLMDGQQDNQQEERLLMLSRIQSLVLASQCREATCQLANCQREKRVMEHLKVCEHKMCGGCPIYEEYINLCSYHVKFFCKETTCLVPFCKKIKRKLEEFQMKRQAALELAQLHRPRWLIERYLRELIVYNRHRLRFSGQ